MTEPELVLRWSDGELDLMGVNEGDHGEFRIDTLADGTEWGNPEPVRRALRRFLLDGSVSVKEYDDNRKISLSLRVSASDGLALAGGEVPLAQADGRRCELLWTPPDEFAPPAAFVAVSSDLRHSMNDLGERRLERFYTLTLECLPYAYSAEYVEVPALPSTESVPTMIDDGTSTTGWATDYGTLGTSGGAVTVTIPDPAGVAGWVNLTRTGAVSLSTEPYLRVIASATPALGAVETVSVLVGSTWHTLARVAADGQAQIYDADDFPLVDAIRIQFSYPSNSVPGGYVFSVASLEKQATTRTSDALQQLRTIAVPGSRRTAAEIVIESPSDAGLSTLVVYTGPEYDPSLSRGAQGSRWSQAGTFTGTRSDLDGGTPTQDFRIPVREFPRGGYVLWAHARTSAGNGANVTITCRLLDGTTSTLLLSTTFGTWAITESTPSYGFRMFPAAAGTLPPWDLPEDSPHVLEFRMQFTKNTPGDPSAFMSIDEIWALNITDGTPTIIEAGAVSRVALTPPSLDRDAPTVLLGDGSSALPVSLTSQLPAWGGSHVLQPGVTYMLTAALGASDAEVSARFRPAHHTHPTS